MVLFPNCKINLGLQILDKRTDGYHNLETVFYPVPLYDGLEIIATPGVATTLTTSGIDIDTTENICLKAYHLLKQKFPFLPEVHIHLHKVIPTGAGLGGGSADGAFTLLLLNQKFRLDILEKDLLNFALQLGSDCPFFIINKPVLATGRGEKMDRVAIDLSSYQLALINPGIPISTATAFANLRPFRKTIPVKAAINAPVHQWKEQLVNDFEESIFPAYPPVKEIKDELYRTGAEYASMSGSGSSVYGLFKKGSEMRFSFPSHYFVKIMSPF